MRILANAINSIGIGHLSRLIGLCDTMRRLDPSLEILFLTEITDFRLLQTYNFPYYFSPPPRKITEDKEYKALGIRMGNLIKNNVIKTITNSYKPDLVLYESLVDTVLFDNCKKLGSKQIFITRQRDNLTDIFREYQKYLKEMGLVVLVEGNSKQLRKMFDFNFYDCGQIIRRHPSEVDTDSIKKRYRITTSEPLITISNGGGTSFRGFEDNYWEVVFNTLETLDKQKLKFKVLAVTGPMSVVQTPPKYKHIEVIIRDYEPNLIDLFFASNLNICRGGYNTINEILSVDANAICIPAERSSDNQMQRIVEATKRSKRIEFCILDKDELSVKISHFFEEKYVVREKRLQSHSTDKYLKEKVTLSNKILSLVKTDS